MATSDDASDDARVSSLNSAINGWKGITLTLFDALRMIGSAFGVGGEVQAALDASGAEQQQQQHRAEAAAKGKAKVGLSLPGAETRTKILAVIN